MAMAKDETFGQKPHPSKDRGKEGTRSGSESFSPTFHAILPPVRPAGQMTIEPFAYVTDHATCSRQQASSSRGSAICGQSVGSWTHSHTRTVWWRAAAVVSSSFGQDLDEVLHDSLVLYAVDLAFPPQDATASPECARSARRPSLFLSTFC